MALPAVTLVAGVGDHGPRRRGAGGWGHGEARSRPNKAVEPTANSLRSYVAPAIGGGSPPALGSLAVKPEQRTERYANQQIC